jgi:hypothetical protein
MIIFNLSFLDRLAGGNNKKKNKIPININNEVENKIKKKKNIYQFEAKIIIFNEQQKESKFIIVNYDFKFNVNIIE